MASGKITTEKAATREEIDAAIAALTDTELVRLQRFASARIARIGAAADGRDYGELVSESYRRVLGSRSWNKDVAFVNHMFGTIRSGRRAADGREGVVNRAADSGRSPAAFLSALCPQ